MNEETKPESGRIARARKATLSGIRTASKKVAKQATRAGKATLSGIKSVSKPAGQILREAAPGLVVVAATGGMLGVLGGGLDRNKVSSRKR